jgi:hypothetical protein
MGPIEIFIGKKLNEAIDDELSGKYFCFPISNRKLIELFKHLHNTNLGFGAVYIPTVESY